MYFTKPNEAVVEVVNSFEKDGKYFVKLSKNPFYPDGFGGQLGDRGKIGNAQVIVIKPEAIEVNHSLKVGQNVNAKVDVERREEIARQHTAQHILSATIEKLFDVDTVGFHMGEESTTVDLDSPIDLKRVEDLTNEVVMSDLEVREMILAPEEVSMYELRKSISEKALKSGKIRLIKIADFDLNACGGFHVSRTGEIGIVKIIHAEKIKGGFTRLWFVAGKHALNDYSLKEEVLLKTSKIFDASWRDLEARVKKTTKESKEKSLKLKKTSESLAIYISKKIRPKEILKLDENVASFVSRFRQDIPYALKYSEFKAIICVPKVPKADVSIWAKSVGLKGGGKGPIYRFSFDNFEKFKKAFESLTEF